MRKKLEELAQKAGEAFVAAGRAATPEQRERYRASAESYQQIVGELRKLRRARPDALERSPPTD